MNQKKEKLPLQSTMLIIDDDPVTRNLLRMVFEYDGFTCIEADNGTSGLTLLDSQSFDIILLDNSMPIMGGMDFLHELQHLPYKPDTPVIMLTGFLNQEVREQATQLGAYTIVGKPFDLGELRSLVAQLTLTHILSPPNKSLLPK